MQEEIDIKKIWDTVLNDMEMSISKPNFNTWFKDTYILKFEEGTIFLSVQNNFVQEWLSSKFHNTILKSLRNISTNIHSLEYVISKEDMRKNIPKEKTILINKELPLDNYYINKEDNLNPRYTFDTFIVGPFNELAHAASQAVIKKPGIVYNPLFIYGNTGHGKTHLIQAIGNHIKNSGRKVFYTTSEKFGQEYVNALQTNRPNFFKEKYRKYDVLIMDDIQFFSEKMKTQEELFHLFNHLYDNNRQIIFSSDKHPALIQGLEERLRGRFSAGMVVDIPAPEAESRVAIIRSKMSQSNYQLSDEIVNFLAYTVTGNIRELEGIINSVVCQSQLKDRELSLQEVKNFVKNNAKPKKNVSTVDVVKTVANFYNIEENSIYEKTRKKEIIKPRQIIMYILREEFAISYPAIGEKLGGRDHTTVMHSCEKIKNDILKDQTLSDEINQLRSILV
jgi:chromosomal replication initiator protein